MRKESIKRVVPQEVQNEIARLQEVEKNQEVARRERAKSEIFCSKKMESAAETKKAPKATVKKRKLTIKNCKAIKKNVTVEMLQSMEILDRAQHEIDATFDRVAERRETMAQWYRAENKPIEIIKDKDTILELIYTQGIAESLYKSLLRSLAYPKTVTKNGKVMTGNATARALVDGYFQDSICEDLHMVVINAFAENVITEIKNKKGKVTKVIRNIELHKMAERDTVTLTDNIQKIKGKNIHMGYDKTVSTVGKYQVVYLDTEEDENGKITSEIAKKVLSSVRNYMYSNKEKDSIHGRLYAVSYTNQNGDEIETNILESVDNANKILESDFYTVIDKIIVNEIDKKVVQMLIMGYKTQTIAKNLKMGRQQIRSSVERIKIIVLDNFTDAINSYDMNTRKVLISEIDRLKDSKKVINNSKFRGKEAEPKVKALKDKTAQQKTYVYHDYKRINGGAIVGIGYDMPIQWIEKKEVPRMTNYSNGYISALQNEMVLHNSFINAIDTDKINSNRTAIMDCISTLTTALNEMK